MQLEPKHEYSAKIYAEIASATGAKTEELAGKETAAAIFSCVAKQTGKEDANRLMQILGLKPGNAASAALLVYAASNLLDLESTLVKVDANQSQVRTNKCLYGSIVSRYKHMLVCNICTDYNAGLAEAAGASFLPGEGRISTGKSFCAGTYECKNPSNTYVPSKTRIDLLIRIVKLLTNKNELMVSTLSKLFIGLGDSMQSKLGSEVANKAARNAYAAGEYHSRTFPTAGIGKGPEDAANTVCAVREATECRTSTYTSGGGFTIHTKNCPQRDKCITGGFLETACTEYTRGLLSIYGNYEIKTSHEGTVCRQDFLQTTPKNEGRTNAP